MNNHKGHDDEFEVTKPPRRPGVYMRPHRLVRCLIRAPRTQTMALGWALTEIEETDG